MMNDDTTRTDGWSSSESSSGAPESGAQSESQNAAERVGFCQDCGKPLTQATVRAVGTGIFCEPCLTARVGATTPPSSYATVPPYTAVPPQAAVTSEPSPVLATILGFIPGVGAMYNGQFAKGIVHLLIFAILVSLSDNVNGIFGLFVAGWIFYMAFEAYHTAVARRDGLPLPNAFGFNDIGERMGFGRSWGIAGSAKVNRSGAPPAPGTVQPADPIPGSEYVPVNAAPVGATHDWVGYVPPTAFTNPPPVPPAVGVTPDLSSRRFPSSAFWLIGLGILILVANLLPDWKLTERWWPPVLFAGLSVWTFTRRLRSGARLVCIIRWPIILMVLAVILALHAAYFVVTPELTISVLLIVFGTLLLLERTAGAGPVYTPPVVATAYPETSSAADAQAEEARSRAAWAATDGGETRSDPDSTKGGQ
jgi:TM2 domain-containing membrane protein YozV